MVEPDLPDGAILRVALNGPDDELIERARWRRDGRTTVVEISNAAKRFFEKPASIRLLVESAEEQFHSTWAVVNNRVVLQASSAPVGARDRSRIPENLVPESFEEAMELLETLNRLLAMDIQQLRGHRGISEQVAEELEREEATILEDEDYNPEDHIVDEQAVEAAPKQKPLMTPVGSTEVSKLKPSYQPMLLDQPMSASPASPPRPRRLHSRMDIAELSRAS